MTNLQLIDEVDWHGIEVNEIFLDRNHPGIMDTLILSFVSPDGTTKKLVFNNCWQANLNMNFGVIATESIEIFEIERESEEVQKFRDFWKFKIEEDLYFSNITFGSTNSRISVISSEIRID